MSYPQFYVGTKYFVIQKKYFSSWGMSFQNRPSKPKRFSVEKGAL
jgi:hypothetical protein